MPELTPAHRFEGGVGGPEQNLGVFKTSHKDGLLRSRRYVGAGSGKVNDLAAGAKHV